MKAIKEIVFNHAIEDRVYRFHIPDNAQLPETYEAVGAFMDEVVRMINDHQEKRAKLEVVQDEVEEKVE